MPLWGISNQLTDLNRLSWCLKFCTRYRHNHIQINCLKRAGILVLYFQSLREDQATLNSRSIWKLNFSGWILFTLSAIFFIWSSIRAGDIISFIASALFLVACFLFLIPVWKLRHKSER